MNITDRYNFDNLWSSKSLGAITNNLGYHSQKSGVMNSFKISIDFDVNLNLDGSFTANEETNASNSDTVGSDSTALSDSSDSTDENG